MEISFSNKNTGFYQPLKSVGELSTLTLDKNISLIEQISNELGVQAIYFEGGTLVVDDYSGQNNRDGIYKLTSTLEENKKPTRRVLVAKAADIKAYKSEKVTSVDTGVGEYDQEKTLLQFQDLMQNDESRFHCSLISFFLPLMVYHTPFQDRLQYFRCPLPVQA